MTAVNTLVLWDIDRTLLTIEGVSRDLYATAFCRVTGRKLEQMPGMAGKTDRSLIESVLAAHGIETTAAIFDAFCSALVAAARERREDMRTSGRALPGARAALEALTEADGLVQSVVTGNLRPIAEVKLALFDLDAHIDFDVGGYGSDDSDRAVLVRRALERTAAKFGQPLAAQRAVVIGDTMHDIAGAVDNDVAAIGIASGEATAADLADAGANAVLPSLEDTGTVVRTILKVVGATGSG